MRTLSKSAVVSAVAGSAAFVGLLGLAFWFAPGADAVPVRHVDESIVGYWAPLRQTVNELSARVASHKPRIDRFPREGDLHYECVSLPGIPLTTLCLFNIRLLMSAALSRVSYYSENEKRVLSDIELLEEVKNSNALGFNVSAPLVADFERKREASREFRATRPVNGNLESIQSAERVFFTTEETFEEAILRPLARTSPPVYLITATADDDLEVLLGHEFQHAQFFHDERFRGAVERYWRDAVSSSDQDAFRAAIAESYDVGNARVVLDEFQAYVLMDAPTVAGIVPLANRHREPLRRALEGVGATPYRDAFATGDGAGSGQGGVGSKSRGAGERGGAAAVVVRSKAP
jgi:hypothetical protein